MMADENMQEWGTSAEIEQATVKAVVDVYAKGDIDLSQYMEARTDPKYLRYAPSFLTASAADAVVDNPKPYTMLSVAKFLRWTKKDGRKERANDRVANAFAALEAIEEGELDEEDIKGLSSSQLKAVLDGSRKIKNTADKVAKANPDKAKTIKAKGKRTAKAAVKKATTELRKKNEDSKQGKGMREVKDLMDDASNSLERVEPPKEIPPSVYKFCRQFAGEIFDMFGNKDKRWKNFQELDKYKNDIDMEDKVNVIVALEKLSDRCLRMANILKGTNQPLLK